MQGEVLTIAAALQKMSCGRTIADQYTKWRIHMEVDPIQSVEHSVLVQYV